MQYDLFGTPDGAVYERLNNYALVHLPNSDFAARYYGADWQSKVTKVDDIWTVGWIAEDPRPLKAQIETMQTQVNTMVAQVESIKKDYKDITKELQDSKNQLVQADNMVDELTTSNKKLQDKLDTTNTPNVQPGATQSLWDIIKSWFGK